MEPKQHPPGNPSEGWTLPKKVSAGDGLRVDLGSERQVKVQKVFSFPQSPKSPEGRPQKTAFDRRITPEKGVLGPVSKKPKRRNALQQYVDERRREYGSMNFNSTLSKATADKYLKDSYDFTYETYGDRYILHKKHTFSIM